MIFPPKSPKVVGRPLSCTRAPLVHSRLLDLAQQPGATEPCGLLRYGWLSPWRQADFPAAHGHNFATVCHGSLRDRAAAALEPLRPAGRGAGCDNAGTKNTHDILIAGQGAIVAAFSRPCATCHQPPGTSSTSPRATEGPSSKTYPNTYVRCPCNRCFAHFRLCRLKATTAPAMAASPSTVIKPRATPEPSFLPSAFSASTSASISGQIAPHATPATLKKSTQQKARVSN